MPNHEEHIKQLSPKKQAILFERLKQKKQATLLSRIQRGTTENWPLSFAQQRLWFLHQWEPESTAYHLSFSLWLHGLFHVSALLRGLVHLIERHETLRMCFISQDEQIVQRIIPAQELVLSFPLIDLSALPPVQQQTSSQQLLHEIASLSFDLRRASLLRGCVLRLGQEEHLLSFTLHHIICDGWSIGILMQELSALYDAFCHQRPALLPALPLQYIDYTIWQRNWLETKMEEQLSYWQAQLRGAPVVLELPTDHPRTPRQSARGRLCSFVLDAPLTRAIKALSHRENVTLFMTLLAAFQVLLMRYSGQDDIIVGTPVANRNHTELEQLIGCFVNTLVLRGDLSGNPGFRELLARTREVTLQAYAHQELPFEKLVEALQPARDLNHSPLFQVLFAVQNAPASQIYLADLRGEVLDIPEQAAKFDLSLFLWEEGEHLRGSLEYNAELFEQATIDRLLEHLRMLLRSVASDLDQPIGSLTLLTPAEQQQILQEWNQAYQPSPGHSVQHFFEEQAELVPHRVAIVDNDHHLTYEVLNQRANQLAHQLQRLGIGTEAHVGLCLHRSPELIMAMLAVLKAGGSYVPLDPTYPTERLNWLLRDANVAITLVASPAMPADVLSSFCYLDISQWSANSEPAFNLALPIDEVQGCYTIYTSGSTGTPKGVTTTHQAVVNLYNAIRRTLGIDERCITLAITTATFDIAAFELLFPLLAGGRVVIAEKAATLDGQHLQTLLSEHAITFFQATPATWHLLRSSNWPGDPELCLLSGGEALSGELAAWLQPRGRQLWNLYGPTEATIWATAHLLLPHEDVPPIGHPLPNASSFVLDSSAHLLPPGIPGELFLGGSSLARGYLHLPALTAERFLPDPFSSVPGARLYRTGDRVCWRADGSLQFLGRLDEQIKLRGYRIEPAEIERCLRQCEGVEQAVVMVQEHSEGDRRLLAYLQSQQEEAQVLKRVRQQVRLQLPEYMQPGTYLLVPSFPLTPSGKINRRALPLPQERTADMGQAAAPNTPAEEILQNLWADVLGYEPIGVHDNFFDLGGHSLLATQLVARIRTTFGVSMPLRVLFETPTISALVQRLPLFKQETSSRSLFPLMPRPAKEIPLSSTQRRFWFLHQWSPDSAAYHLPFALRLRGSLQLSALRRSFSYLLMRHEMLRTCFTLQADQPFQHILAAEKLALFFPLIDLSEVPAAHQQELSQHVLQQVAWSPFDLRQAPLLRVCILRLSQEEHLLYFTLHHIICDGWSIGILINELSTLYQAFCQNQLPVLPSLRLQYADYSLWQRAWLEEEELRRQADYWATQLAGSPQLNLPTDHPRSALQQPQGRLHSFMLDASLVRALKTLSRQEGCTLFMALLAALQVVLARYSGQNDIVIGTPIANRTQTELEGLVGCFVNTLVLRTDLSGQPGFRTLLKRVREVTLQAYAHQDLPFEKLVEILQPERDPNQPPLFQVIFALQNTPMSKLQLADLYWEPLYIPAQTAKFDLSLILWEENDSLRGSLEYNATLFEQNTIARLCEHLRMLLRAAVNNPDQPIISLNLLLPVEEQLIQHWNQTERPFPQSSVAQLFEEQVAQTPERIALSAGELQLSYAALNQYANQLAHRLRQAGVILEERVGLCLHRSPALVITMLAVLKAGGTYVPLDPAHPQHRLRFMLTDASVSILLTHNELTERFASLDIPFICLDREQESTIARQSRDNLPMPLEAPLIAHTLAYIIYTSGSTGTPKGVAISHQAIGRLVFQKTYAPLRAAERVAQASNVSFDAATFEIWASLLQGACLVLLNQDILLSPRQLAHVLNDQAVTTLFLTTALFNLLAREEPLAFAGLRHLLFGGEAVDPRWVRRILTIGSPERLVHVYGPTECTTFATWYPLEGVPEGATSLPIGGPLDNTQLFVLDRHLQPVPPGVPGELYLGGEGLARGYINQPDLTAERFVPHPYSSRPGARLYRTGDSVRQSEEGTLEFLGRFDRQIKLRGFRIEPGEIETRLREHPAIQDVIVRFVEDEQQHYLAAYLVVSQEAASTQNEFLSTLQRFLQQRLPEYMIPGALIMLDHLPTTLNGKIDIQALPMPTARNIGQQADFVAPRDMLELYLVQIFEEQLNRHPLSIKDNFFHLGGHSLLAVRIITQIRKKLSKDILLSQLFEKPTVEQLAQLLRQQSLSLPRSPIVTLQPGNSRSPLYCVHPAGGEILCYMDLARHLGIEQLVYGIQSLDMYGEHASQTKLESLAIDYNNALQEVQPHGPYCLTGWSFGGVIAFEMAQQLRRKGEEIALLALIDTVAPQADQEEAALDDVALITYAIQDFIAVSRKDQIPSLPQDQWLHSLSEEELWSYFARTLKAARFIEAEEDLEIPQLRRSLNTIRNNMAALKTYSPQVYPGCITLFSSSQLREARFPHDPTLGWSRFSSEAIDLQLIEGFHRTLAFDPTVRPIAQYLRACLDHTHTR